ncbi:nudix family hydrolase-like protein [Lophiostoma macrostomum CBS 122681]|uniref:Nudix family hydrolase-like protein n=1 Tax=Lophiostoma macrostomum CBS 122681 TaxID=1314788 RepID=A0A6A6TJR0_9PLEO|nr:nudix family hydrolase-like protein [Lophiostoma macrostomum CBS 122681]
MAETGTEDLVSHLKNVLLELASKPYPEVACPPNLPKRASVAVILRVQPNYNHWPAVQSDPPRQRRRSSVASQPGRKLSFKNILDAFFEQDWVKHGDPEMLFIKRATRIGDKWNGHVALPGGKRDPEDDDDQVTAMREAMEEVGIDLSYSHAIAVGNLPQRVVTTSWGKVPLMVLCPYVYLLTSPTPPPQRLQPTEVASTHWVSLRALLSPALRTHEYADVSNRLAKSELGIKRWFLQAMLSKMMFAAIRLVPSSSTYCSSIPGFVPEGPAAPSTPFGKIRQLFTGSGSGSAHTSRQPPLLLWGLTLGVISDFLEHIPPHNALELWTYPTFTNWDVRFTMWVLSYGFRKRKAVEMSSSGLAKTTGIVQDVVEDVEMPKQELLDAENVVAGGVAGDEEGKMGDEDVVVVVEEEGEEPGEVGIAGLGVGRHWGKRGREKMIARGAAVNSMLEGYYPIVRRAVATALVGRITVVSLLVAYLWNKYGRHR